MTAALSPKDRFGALSRMLAPLSVEEFLATHLERTPVHIGRSQPGYFDDMYTIADVEDALVVGAREPDLFALIKSNAPEVGASQFTYERPGVRWRLTGKAPQR